ncbi:MAG: serine/threonine protein kinase [Wenzhouxiangella sp.]|nr:MAG: serine/threonine protein kinase [Wenzhouxiangella sp.]
MDAKRWQAIGDLFTQLSELDDPDMLAHRLDALRAEDAALAAEVEALLASHGRGNSFLDQPAQAEATAMLAEQVQSRLIGQKIGPWIIDALLSEGGMGSVYRAHRDNKDFGQHVALKLIRAGLESPQLIERFGHERLLLAKLSHANIARLIDGGTSQDGLPWLAMEYVDGLPIDQWCDEQRLDVNQRLGLFDQVCSAVHFAHQNLIIHRDIKPANVLVDEHGQVKLLDFGIAKLIENSVDPDKTRTQLRMITPSAASPEQFRGEPVTTASDVYSLGLLLYRLLTGGPAYRIDATTPVLDTERLICRDMPTRPSLAVRASDALEAIAQARQTRPDRLPRQLRGDLDTIVLKALRKEPRRRYGSVAELAEDLHRYRRGLPVAARPDSVGYRARKFVTRHWVGLTATASTFAALLIGLAVAIHQTGQARAERDRAQQINQFLQTILLEADPYQAGAEATVRDVLRTASTMIGERFPDQPAIEAPLRHTIGYTQLSLMELDAALANLARADQLNRQLYGRQDDRTLMTQAYIAWIDYRRGDPGRAEAGYRAVLERLGPHHDHETRATIHNDFGVILAEMERWEEALEQQQKSLQIWLDHEPERAEVGIAYNNIAFNLHGLERLEEAREWYERALDWQRREAPEGGSVDLAYNLNNYGILLRDLGLAEQAMPYYRESLAMRINTLGPEHAFTGTGHLNLGRLLLEMGRTDEAREELERAVEISEATLQEDQLQMLLSHASLARARFLQGETEGAAARLHELQQRMIAANAPQPFLDQIGDWLRAAQQAEP